LPLPAPSRPEAAANPQRRQRARLVRAVAAARTSSPNRLRAPRLTMTVGCSMATVPSAGAASQACRRHWIPRCASGNCGPSRAAPMPAPAPAPAPRPRLPPQPLQPMISRSISNSIPGPRSRTAQGADRRDQQQPVPAARPIQHVGHTDTSGPSDYNQKLSVKRAKCRVEALIDMVRAAQHCMPAVWVRPISRSNRRRRQGSQEPPYRDYIATIVINQSLIVTMARARRGPIVFVPRLSVQRPQCA